eukprot:4486618-Pyramimonas_sp.AAC.1
MGHAPESQRNVAAPRDMPSDCATRGAYLELHAASNVQPLVSESGGVVTRACRKCAPRQWRERWSVK